MEPATADLGALEAYSLENGYLARLDYLSMARNTPLNLPHT